MFAIIETGGKQYRVSENQKLVVEKTDSQVGEKISISNVLLVKNEKGDIQIGSPFVQGATVEAEIVKIFKDKKVIIFKKRRRQNSRRKMGHRQSKMELKIISIK